MNKEYSDNYYGNRKPKVGIVTLPGNFNYGNKLQLYACMRIWEQFGFEPEFLSAGWCENHRHPVRDWAKFLLLRQKPSIHPEDLSSPERLEAFARFNRLIPERCVNRPSSHLADEYHLFSVGSDQVWNVAAVWPMAKDPWPLALYRFFRRSFSEKRYLDWWFLRFCRIEQRICLAPSIGADEVSVRAGSLLSRGVAGFRRLSVREERGVQILRDAANREAELLCDPTIVLESDEWRAIADDRITPDGSYVLTYLLGGTSKDAQEVLDLVTERGAIPVVALSDRMQPGEPPAGPAEFLSLVEHATHVVTDSFHASVFAMLMQVPLTITRRVVNGSATNMFSRLESLADNYGLEDKIYGAPSFKLDQAGRYPKASLAIVRERNKFMAYVRDCLSDVGLSEMSNGDKLDSII